MAVDWKVPIDEEGNQVSWAARTNVKMVEPWEFKDTLRYLGFSRGRSALNVHWQSESTGKKFVSGMPMLDEAVKKRQVCNGCVTGSFYFKKQGSSVLLQIK